ncbi:metallophosphoesterase [Helicobacter enhydrae]|uniref:Metallophosphoesterase n=1 Tax=Helicobacter enhydrae TaxID=222136 RepID=A0A1B1U5B9_9HELI|nr:TIGR00282 family metallophosphoesterase [Helicobacter enhydrae]ANV97892.1 metallophosphoesterase [Helicobacter enhydrae]
MTLGLIGDIVGKPARVLLAQLLPQIKQQYKVDFVIANGENASHGFGITHEHIEFLLKSGVDVITGGNHSFDKKDAFAYLQHHTRILRPHNASPLLPGSGVFVGEICDEKIAVLNLMGHFGMPHCQNAFLCAKETIAKLKEQGVANIIIDFHAEATSEKRTMFEMLKGEVSAIFGTHTHIGTDDLMIEDGSFYVSDIGMCGAFDSVIGMDPKAPIQRALNGVGVGKFEVSESSKVIFQMVIVELENTRVKRAFKLRYLQKWLPTLEAIVI